jgi:predicted transcriptional regulator
VPTGPEENVPTGPGENGPASSAAAETSTSSAVKPAGAAPTVDPLALLRADPRQAIQDDHIRCLMCGRAFRQLTNTHLRKHQMSASEYKRRFGYNRGRPLMCRELQVLYADRAVKSGLAARIRSRPILVQPELRRRGGARTIALEELLTRRDARRPGGSREGTAG